MKFLVVLVTIGLLTACGDGKFSSPKGTITSTQAASFAQLKGASSPASAVKVNVSAKPNDLPTSGLTRDDEDTSCTTYEPASGSQVDADSDGTPLTQKVTWACTNVSTDDRSTYTRNGTQTITDKDDTNANGGYKYEYDVVGSGSGNYTFNYEYKGYFELTKSARDAGYLATSAIESGSRHGSWGYKTDWSGAYNYSYNGATRVGNWGHTFDYTMTETAARDGDSSGQGTASFEGFYAYTSSGEGDSRSSSAIDVVFRVKSTGLEWQRSSCNNFYKAGQIQWTDGSGNIMVWIYNSCTSRRVTYNGSTVFEN